MNKIINESETEKMVPQKVTAFQKKRKSVKSASVMGNILYIRTRFQHVNNTS